MPKITKWAGPSHVTEEGAPIAGPVGHQVIPDAPHELIEIEGHPDDSGEVDDEQAEYLARFGGESGQYNPTEHSVSDVLAYLDGVDSAERERVIDEEMAGKGRKGILG